MRNLLACFALAAAALLPSLTASAQSPLPAPPVMRLGDAVRPLAYDLALTLLPDEPRFRGRVEIDVDITRPLDFFWLNGHELEVRDATLVVGGRTLRATASAAEGGNTIGVRLPETVPAGKARLALEFSGRISTNDTRGVFKQRDGERWYAFTQFESINARRAFPCFDEPHWKTPWTVTLTVRRDHVAVANTPAVQERDLGDGLKQVRFAPTQPLPSYLVAFAAGPFEVVDGGKAGRAGTDLRYIVPAGRGAETRFVKQATPRVLELLEQYFDSPYPYGKLDSLVIPVTVNFWAMENPGLITYRSSLLLARPEQEDDRFQQLYVSIGAHEIAHQWFGNLVTMQWWDDLWLKESFATWLARKVAQGYNPQWEQNQRREQGRQTAFATDRLQSTRQVRQPVNSRDDLSNAYDRITYDKGGAVLGMFEAWLGETRFRDGVRRYMAKHAHGNATTSDFFAAIGAADADIARGFASFVSQPGMPLVDVELDCNTSPALRLRQQRFLPAAPTASNQQWLIPVCVRYDDSGTPRQHCALLREREQRIELPGAARCPAWVLPNPGGLGYYLTRLGPQARARLAAAPLQEPEAIALLAEQTLLANSAGLPAGELLELAAPLAADPRPEVGTAVAVAIEQLDMLAANDPRWRASLQRWIAQHLTPRARQLGWVNRADDSDAVRKLRGYLLPLTADLGADPDLRQQARALAFDWLAGKNRAQLGANARSVLRMAAHEADGALFDALVATLRQAGDAATRGQIYDALGRVRDPVLLRRAVDLSLDPGLDPREAVEMFMSASDEPANANTLITFVRERYTALAARLPEESMARMPRMHQSVCTAEGRAQVQALYGARMHTLSGGGRNLAQVLERIDICIANQRMQQAAATR